jgi:hypothetical protein
MGIGEQVQRRVKLGGFLRGLGLAAFFVVANGLAAFHVIPSSYQQFSWEAYAEVVYTDTPTATPTGTPTQTPTPKIPDGGNCGVPSDCQSGFCVDSICCNTACDQPMQTCASGTCTGTTSAAPVVSHRALAFIVALLVSIGFFALTPLRFGKRR